jgi:glycosyltransferase involved in cell wall biosynthesis
MSSDSLHSPNLVAFVPVMDNYGGIERNLIALSSFWHRRGKTLEILCFRCRTDLQAFADHPLFITALTESENPLLRAKLLAAHLERRYRETGCLPLLFGIKAAFYMGMVKRSPFVLHFTDPPSLIRETPIPGIKGMLRRVGAHFLTLRGVRRAHRMITMTRRNAEELRKVYGRESDVVFQGGNPPGADFQRRDRGDDEPVVVLSACRLESSKRIEWILDGVSRYNATAPAIRAEAVIVGRGSAESALRAHGAAIGESVRFTGEIPQDELERIFATASLFAVPAVQGFGLPALEALYRNVPVVVHEDSGVAEALGEEKMAVVCRGDATEFARTLAKTLGEIAAGEFPSKPSTHLPTEDGWCQAIGQICRWTAAS